MLAQIVIIIVIAIWVQPPGDVVRQEDLKPGDHIYTYRLYGLYTHHGIYVGEGDVIHLTRTGVDKTSLNRFQQEGKDLYSLRLYAYGRPQLGYWLTRWGTCTTLPETKSPQEVMNKARELHEHDSFGEYDLISNNCEHFASFCRTSIRASAQTALISACGQKISEVKEWFMKFLQTNFGLEWAARGMHTCTEEVLRYENVCKPQLHGHYYLMCPERCKGFCLLVLGPPS